MSARHHASPSFYTITKNGASVDYHERYEFEPLSGAISCCDLRRHGGRIVSGRIAKADFGRIKST